MLKFDKKEAAFCKKRRKNFFESGPWALRILTPMTRIQNRLFASRRAALIHPKPIML
jgi:hypothetical protein